MEETELLTVEQVAAKLQTTPTTIRRWLRAGKLRGVRLGGTRLGWRIRQSEIDRFMAEHEGRLSA
jgi:excisionase family DNA binding protein